MCGKALILALAVALFGSQEVLGRFVSQKTVEKATARLRGEITGLRAAHAIRLAFHDCVGGCDGCINLDNPFNAAIPGSPGSWHLTIDLINDLYDAEFCESGLSRADFYVLAGMAGVSNAVDLANENLKPGDDPVPIVSDKESYFHDSLTRISARVRFSLRPC